MGKIIRSDPFQYATLMAILSALAVAFASVGSYFMAQYSAREAVGTFFIGMIPILARLKEGIGDHDKVSIPADTSAVQEVK